jgi:LysM domain
MRSAMQKMASVGLLLAVEAGAVVALHRLGQVAELRVPLDDLGQWIATTNPEVVITATSRLVALVLAWWLLGSTTLYALARAAHRDALAVAFGSLTLPAVRRMLDRTIAGTVLATTLLVRAPAAPAGPPTDRAPESIDPRSGRLDSVATPPRQEVREGRVAAPGTEPVPPSSPPAPESPPVPVDAGADDPASEPDRVLASPAAAGTYVVVAGDNLWTIAARQVAGSDRGASDVVPGEVAPYWHALVDRNRARLVSGDPDLLFPGEVLELP